MSLPDLIRILPPERPQPARITVPGSKSITNRALILAALGNSRVELQGALWSEDTQVMVACLRTLGFVLEVTRDPLEPGNRSIIVTGQGGRIGSGGSEQEPLELAVANAGTAARFLPALACLGRGVYRISGVPRMHERPMAALFGALRQLGYRVDSTNDRLPALVHGGGHLAGTCEVGVSQSSQFASALLLAAPIAGWDVRLLGETAKDSPYVAMTRQLIAAFPKGGSTYRIEPDASGGSYFWAAGNRSGPSDSGASLSGPNEGPGFSIRVEQWPTSGWQIDQHFPRWLEQMMRGSTHFEIPPPNAGIKPRSIPASEPLRISRERDLGDSIMTAIALAPLAARPMRFTDLGRLRLQECERVEALRVELTRCGARVEEGGDTLTITPSRLQGASIRTYGDHRMAMCFSILGLKIPGMNIQDPGCVRKTFPTFFQKLAARPPVGVGARILDGETGATVPLEDLYAG